MDIEEAFQRIKSGGGEVIVPLEHVYHIVPTNGRTAQPSLGDLKSNGFSQLIGGGRGTICNEVFEKPRKRRRPDEQPEGYLGFFRAKVVCAEAGNPATFLAFKEPPPRNIGALFQAASKGNDLTLAPVAADGAVFKVKCVTTRRTTPFFAGVLDDGGAPSDISSPTDDSTPPNSPDAASDAPPCSPLPLAGLVRTLFDTPKSMAGFVRALFASANSRTPSP